MYSCIYTQGTKLAVVISEDLITILASNPKMQTLLCKTTTTFVERETGAISGIERAAYTGATDATKRNIAHFEENKLIAIRVRNDITYTASLRSYHLLE